MSVKEFPLWIRRTIALAMFTGSVCGAYAAAESKIDGRVEEKVNARMLVVEAKLTEIEKRLDRLESKIDRLIEVRYK